MSEPFVLQRALRRRIAATLPIAVLCASLNAQVPDPLAPPDAVERARWSDHGAPSTDPLRVEMILIGPDRRMAVINGRRLVVGDRIGDARIVEIQPGVVRVDVDGTERDLRVRTSNRTGNQMP